MKLVEENVSWHYIQYLKKNEGEKWEKRNNLFHNCLCLKSKLE